MNSDLVPIIYLLKDILAQLIECKNVLKTTEHKIDEVSVKVDNLYN